MKKKVRSFPEIFRKVSGIVRPSLKKGLLILLLLALAVGPVLSAAAASSPTRSAPKREGMLQTVSQALAPVKTYVAGEEVNILEPLPEGELAEALLALNRFNTAVLKDDRLASALDAIILEIIEHEQFAEGIADKQQFLADIIRDERLVQVLGDVVAEYLMDEQLTADIEYFFSIIFDLLADEEMHFMIRDTVAAFVENPRLEATVNGIITTAIDLFYYSGVEAAADSLLTDPRVPQTINEIIAILVSSLPETAAAPLNDPRVLHVFEELLGIFVEYGTNTAVNMLDDQRVVEAVTEIVMLLLDSVSLPAVQMAADTADYALPVIGARLTDGTLEQVVGGLVDDLVGTEFQNYFNTSFNKIISTAQSRADANTPGDNTVGCLGITEDVNVRKSIARGIAEVPPELVRDGFIKWLVFGNEEYYGDDIDPKPRTYTEWALDFVGLLTPERADALGNALSEALRTVITDFIVEHKDDLGSAIGQAIEAAWGGVAEEIKKEETKKNIKKQSAILTQRIIQNIPLDDLAEHIRQNLEHARLKDIAGEMIEELPFQEAGTLLRWDDRIVRTLTEALPNFSLSNVAAMIRDDQHIISSLADVLADFPVEAITDFLQDEHRANLVGHLAAHTLLNIAADFVDDERTAEFIYVTIIDFLGSFEDTPGTLIRDFLASFLDNEYFAQYLAEAIGTLRQGVNREMVILFKQIVPRFFTGFIWQYR